ncbi:hypothetical protein EJB05_32477 [Eragrostis curvula]|uniref:Phytocyanin domain-containing protein n=1 Tax=Eragrostis curvula TaxID=38414 RepID=A0A5J9UG94_9POAL|nr:hypothetical protein EJB05_32477 [Eragrostis curvula]
MASPLGVITLSLLLVLLTASGCSGREFIVIRDPTEWLRWEVKDIPQAARQLPDQRHARYDKYEGAVLCVSQSHYDACNTPEPFLRLDGVDSRFVLDSSGYHSFISDEAMRCWFGENLSVFVHGVPDNTPSALPPPPQKLVSKGNGRVKNRPHSSSIFYRS